MRTTIELPDALFRAVKTRAVEQGTTLKVLVARFIEAGLRGPGGGEAPKRRQRAPLPVAIERDPGAPRTPALSNADLEALLDGEEVAAGQRVVRSAPSDS